MKIFIDKDAEIIVTLFAYSSGNKNMYWTKNNQKNKPENVDEKTEGVESHTIVFRMPNYKDSVDLVDSGIQFSLEGGMQISTGTMSFERFSRLIKSWDFKDSDGAFVPATRENVSLLDSVAAKCIVEDLENQIFNS